MDEIFELESLEKEFTSIYDAVISDDLDIEECRKLSNKLMLLHKSMNDLGLELSITIKKNAKKRFIVATIQLVISLICLIMCQAFPVVLFVSIANFWIVHKNLKKTVQERKGYTEIFEQRQKMIPLINNCTTFLNKKVDLACNVSEAEQNKEQKEEVNEQNVKLMAANDSIYFCVYNGLPFIAFDEELMDLAIKILQTDLGTEETDIDKLITMAREKVQKESKFTQTLHKKQ